MVHLKQSQGVTIVATNTLKIKKRRCLHIGCIDELQKSHNNEDSSIIVNRLPTYPA